MIKNTPGRRTSFCAVATAGFLMLLCITANRAGASDDLPQQTGWLANQVLTDLAMASDDTLGQTIVAAQHAVLQIEGKIALDGDDHVTLDLATLRSMPLHTLRTSTVVTDGVLQFDGVLMRDVLEYVGADGRHVTATALNGYEIEIPMRDFLDFDVLLAWAVDGELLRVDDKGPFWIVYPRDHHDILQDIRYDYRWVWQLSSLRVH